MARKELSRDAKIHAREYDNIRYSVIGAKLPREQADSFRDICKRNSVSVSAALSVFVRACLQANSFDVIRDDIPGPKNIDPDFPQGDQAGENDTHGTVDNCPGFDTPGTVD